MLVVISHVNNSQATDSQVLALLFYRVLAGVTSQSLEQNCIIAIWQDANDAIYSMIRNGEGLLTLLLLYERDETVSNQSIHSQVKCLLHQVRVIRVFTYEIFV